MSAPARATVHWQAYLGTEAVQCAFIIGTVHVLRGCWLRLWWPGPHVVTTLTTEWWHRLPRPSQQYTDHRRQLQNTQLCASKSYTLPYHMFEVGYINDDLPCTKFSQSHLQKDLLNFLFSTPYHRTSNSVITDQNISFENKHIINNEWIKINVKSLYLDFTFNHAITV